MVDNLPNLDDNNKNSLKDNLKKIRDELFKKFFENLTNYRRKNYIDPVISAVGVLPKEELADMAYSLVNLTSFKRKVSMDAETVGGPIDVAVISKKDGFIWIKRKHYFNKDLNPQFFTNYCSNEYTGEVK
jgi:hypothetical protein